MRKRSNNKKENFYAHTLRDFIIVAILISLGPIFTLLFNLKPLMGGVFLAVPASLFMLITKPKHLLKVIVAVIVLGIIFGFLFDFIAELNFAWDTTRLVFPIKFLGIEPLDNTLGYGLMTLLVVSFYEHFIHHERNNHISKNLVYALIPTILAGIAIIFLYPPSLSGFHLPYIYLIGGLAAVAFPLYLCFRNPRLLIKYISVGVFFAFVWFFSEIAALKTGGWVFNGEYVGNVSVFGVNFPLEEFVFWMLMYAGSLVTYYEFFFENNDQ